MPVQRQAGEGSEMKQKKNGLQNAGRWGRGHRASNGEVEKGIARTRLV